MSRSATKAIAVALLTASCTQEIKGPDRLYCTVFETGKTFTASKENAWVSGDEFHIVDDVGKHWVFPMLPAKSTAYLLKCDPLPL